MELDLIGEVFAKTETPYDAGANWDAGVSRQMTLLNFNDRSIQVVKFKGSDGQHVFDRIELDEHVDLRVKVTGANNGRLAFTFVRFLKPAEAVQPAKAG